MSSSLVFPVEWCSMLNIGILNDTTVSLIAPLWLKVKCCGNLKGGKWCLVTQIRKVLTENPAPKWFYMEIIYHGWDLCQALDYHQCDNPTNKSVLMGTRDLLTWWWWKGSHKIWLSVTDWLFIYIILLLFSCWPGHWSPLATPGPDNVRKLSSVCFPRHGSLCRRGERRERSWDISHPSLSLQHHNGPVTVTVTVLGDRRAFRTVQTGSTEITGLLLPSIKSKNVT